MDSPVIIDFEVSDGNIDGNVPFWLRDVFDRALNATGLRGRSASDEAIAGLIKVDVNQLIDKDCPICYEKFSSEPIVVEESKAAEKTQAEADMAELFLRDTQFKHELNKANVNLEPLQKSAQFSDPHMFFPTDVGGASYSRFPQRNLSTFKRVTIEDQFPGYKSEDKEMKDKRIEKYKKEGHMAVKMPECEHIFGLSCIVEWLKANVSCPLCRREVEAKKNDPARMKREAIENNIVANFNNEEQMIHHMMEHSTDVFNPFRRPFNPAITPVTDSFMHQDWATPSNYRRPSRSRDPSIVLPRRFPFIEPAGAARRFNSLRRNTRDNRRTRNVRRRNNDSSVAVAEMEGEGEGDGEDGRRRRSMSNDSSRSARRVNFSPHTTNIDDLHDDSSDSDNSSIDSSSSPNPPSTVEPPANPPASSATGESGGDATQPVHDLD
ncbi:uncharacterized protein LODBEIA_P19330 [Lodderomyces beijingensis]|uniref:RING-type domain-containing protein n=1 Tax=Lodderomyces beijingensis TaxID=1775926 RepID=A0ABP0ZHS7_9ASCO